MNLPAPSIQRALEAIEAGRLVIIVDAEDRENEGDFFLAAEKATPQMIYFMLARGCGQLCVPVARELASRLRLKPLLRNTANHDATAFAVPVDHRSCKTGISPEERVVTIRALMDPLSRPRDFVRPGHIFPLIARQGGILKRPGHTEAAVDLARLAGLTPAGVLCEICSRDGRHMAGARELASLAEEFELPILAIEDLIRYRQAPAEENVVWAEAVTPAAKSLSEKGDCPSLLKGTVPLLG
jgi:3,4-dihydroxy 2-butanone 4-phosphate synthase/GTP cyclohydrolase II